MCSYEYYCCLQALIGVAFSLGFIFGPTLGAAFSSFTGQSSSFSIFQFPAYFSIATACIVIVLITFGLKETLPTNKRVKDEILVFIIVVYCCCCYLKAKSILGSGISYLINPFSLFRFTAVKKIPKNRKN